MLQCFVEVAGHAQKLGIRILRVRFLGKHGDITVHDGKGFVVLTIVGAGIAEVV